MPDTTSTPTTTENDAVVTGVFGDAWLSTLYGSAVGPSPTPYRFSGRIVEVRADGSALIAGRKRTWDGVITRHADGSRCRNYPCSLDHTHRYECEWAPTQAVVPAYAWSRI
jgi:hypothetical protein